MQINTDVYPEVGYDSYKRWTNDVTYYTAGQPLEHSIFYAGTVSENMQFTDEQNYSYIATAPNCIFNISPKSNIVKGDVFFAETYIRIHDLNSNWETNSGNNPKIITSFDVSKFYFNLNNATCYVYDLSNPDGGHAIGLPETMSFDVYRAKSAEYKSTHLIRKISWNLFNGDSLCNYKEVADYSGIAVCPMIRYTFDDKSVIYALPNLSEYGLPEWAGPINLDRLTDEGTFGAQNSDIYSLVYTYFGKWYNGFISGGAAHRVTCSNPAESSVRVRAANDQGSQVNNGYHMPDIGTIDTDKYVIPVLLWGNQWNKRIEPFYTDEYVMRYFASFGVRFQVGETMYIGYMDSNGWCNGNYILESELADSDSANKNITDFTGSTYDADVPYVPPSPSGDDAEAETFGWGGNEVAGMVRYYLLSQAEMESLQAYMSNPNWRMDYRNCVIGMYVVPNGGLFFDAPVPTTLKFRIGLNETGGSIPQDQELDTGISCLRISGVVNNDNAVIELPRINGNFLDFEPYSKYMVYVPFCGVIPLPDYVAGKEIKVTIYPDVPTCTCTAVVTSEDRKIATAKGAFGSQLPLTSDGDGLKAASVINSLGNFIMGAGEVALGIGTGMVPLAIAGGAQMLGSGLQADLQLGQAFGYSIGASGDTSFFGVGNRCEYYIAYSKWNNPDGEDTNIYGHTYGFVCNKRGLLKDFDGFTVCDNPHVYGFSCTSDEKDEIERLLREGIIIHKPEE